DDAVASRFTFNVEVPLPDEPQRVRLFKIALGKQQKADFNIDEMAAELARKAGGASGRVVGDIVTAASQRALERAFSSGNVEEYVLTAEDLRAQLAPKGKKMSDEELQKIWSQVVLKPSVKQAILSKIQMLTAA